MFPENWSSDLCCSAEANICQLCWSLSRCRSAAGQRHHCVFFWIPFLRYLIMGCDNHESSFPVGGGGSLMCRDLRFKANTHTRSTAPSQTLRGSGIVFHQRPGTRRRCLEFSQWGYGNRGNLDGQNFFLFVCFLKRIRHSRVNLLVK